MKLLLKGGRVLDPAQGLDERLDVLVNQETGRLEALGRRLKGEVVLDVTGLLVVPGLVDLHVHFREPGQRGKETIATGVAAGISGGFTSLVAMPNTEPPLDNEGLVAYYYLEAQRAGGAHVYPAATITKGREGEEMANIGLLAHAGAIAFSDDGASVKRPSVLKGALEYAKRFHKPILEHCEDTDLSEGAIINDGEVSAELGITGCPAVAEEIIADRDVRLAEATGGRLHLQHLSTAGAVEIVRQAKKRGVALSAEVTPHHLLLTEDCCMSFDPVFRVNPPLRTAADCRACQQGLRDGTIDAVASDHAPHTLQDKSGEFIYAPNGMIGLESTLPALLTGLVHRGELPLARLIEALTSGPARVVGLEAGTLQVGRPADLTVIDLERQFVLDAALFASKGRNCPFHGQPMKGVALYTIVGGMVHEALGKRLPPPESRVVVPVSAQNVRGTPQKPAKKTSAGKR